MIFKNLKNCLFSRPFYSTLNAMFVREHSELSRTFRNIKAILSNRMYTPEYSANELTLKAKDDYKSEPQAGRSMIEMLGVLAIIGILSVGGIAGYSKAMLMWHSNMQKYMLTEIITNMIKIKPNLSAKSQTFDNITFLFNEMGELPEGTSYKNGFIIDKDNNRIDISYGLQTLQHQDGHETKSFIYVARFWFISNGKNLTPSAEMYCRNLIEATKPIANEIQLILFIQTDSDSEFNSSGKTVYNRSTLQKATLSDIHQKCKILLKEGGSARFTLYLNPY